MRRPDGRKGSGLNLFIGENGSGKTSAIQLLSLAFQSFSAASRIRPTDFFNLEEKIAAELEFDRFKARSGSPFLSKAHFECTGIEFTAESRDRKQPNRLISEPFAARTHFIVDEDAYREPDGTPILAKGEYKKFDARDKSFDPARVFEGTLPVCFLLERSRARHIGRGQFATTLDRITNEISWRFRKQIKDVEQEDDYQKVHAAFTDQTIKSIPKEFGPELTDALAQLLEFPVSLNPLSYSSPFDNLHFATTSDNAAERLPVEMLGSGVEMIIALQLQCYLAEHAKEPLILLIDEPEMHLHPRLQTKLAKFFFEKSANHQIILTSHSPYIVRDVGSDASVVQFALKEGKSEVTPMSGLKTKLRHGLTVNEVNFLVFGMPSVEYLDELWGSAMLQFEAERVRQLDEVLVKNGLSYRENWRRSDGNDYAVTLPHFVRNSVHHPENKHNRPINDQDVYSAIEGLRSVL
ncbi:AAA ATPase domain-containing protein [Yoonia litorea]|uniref:AAA ATPase domain-containing protein n=1 Tax=Yoonia litorea TaxID=1123755 RepID=A0A1I6MHI9_9RHOB|nr:AAA ATPase domain-containing protein [Yoonia litorea]